MDRSGHEDDWHGDAEAQSCYFQSSLDFGQELVIDLFAGGGGASLGLARAYREPDVAVNHNPVAIAVHRANHPNTLHLTCDVFEVDPLIATGGRPVGLLWASPDCRHFSKAKGGKPVSKRVRGLAWVVVKWAKAVRPRILCLENVAEFRTWGPIGADGLPCPQRKGLTFRRWVRQLERLGYKVEFRELAAYTQGTPTMRKRLYMIARCDGRPIVWPKEQFGSPEEVQRSRGKLQPWRAAAECIDWALPGKSIFGRKKPLVNNTCRRLAKGLWRYVLNEPAPFIVPLRGTSASHTSSHELAQPLSTITGGGTHHALVVPHITKFRTGSVGSSASEPLATITAGGAMKRPAGAAHALGVVSAHIVHLTHQGERTGNRATEPLRTVTANRGEQTLVSAVMASWMEQANEGPRNKSIGGVSIRRPMSTICGSGSHQQLATAFLAKYYREGGQWQALGEPMHTIPTKDRMAVVLADQARFDGLTKAQFASARRVARFMHKHLPELVPEAGDLIIVGDYALVDITLRMLMPRELARANGFPDDYILERGHFVDANAGEGEWKPVTKTDQVKLIGNMVCPQVAEALVRSNLAELIEAYARAA